MQLVLVLQGEVEEGALEAVAVGVLLRLAHTDAEVLAEVAPDRGAHEGGVARRLAVPGEVLARGAHLHAGAVELSEEGDRGTQEGFKLYKSCISVYKSSFIVNGGCNAEAVKAVQILFV